MKKRCLISLIIMMMLCASSFASLTVSQAAPSPTPDTSTSTVTSPDGTTKTVNSDGDVIETPSPKPSTPAPAETPEPTPEPLPDGVIMEEPELKPPNIRFAESALVMDMQSGRVFYSKNLDERLYPASTTKIMTGILALENLNMEDNVTATYEAIKDITLEDSQMGILIGEELTVEQLIKSMLIHSANDSANVLAIQTSGSLDAFVDMMNQKAQELGMTGTHFQNACGIHDDNHYTTARDLAILAKYAMKNEQFREIVKMPIYKIPPTNKYAIERVLVNTNLFLGTSRSTYHYYPPAIGIKTGHTSQAGYCLVSAATYNNMELLAIVMKCPDENTGELAYSYIDSKTLFDFGFDNYSHQEIATVGSVAADSKVYEAKDDMRVAVTVEQDLTALLPNSLSKEEIQTDVDMPEQIEAPVSKGDVLGSITYSYNGIPIGESRLIATNDVERNEFLHIFHLIMRIITSPFFFIPALAIIFILIYASHRKKKRERQKRIQQIRKNRAQNSLNAKTPDRRTASRERNQKETRGENSRYRREK